MSVKSTSTALIDLDRVDVEIDAVTILHDISWRLEPGRHWGIVGPNGSGKSTFLALAAGERWPAPGRGTRRYDFGAGPQRDAVAARREIAAVGPELQDRYEVRGWSFAALDVVLSGCFRTDVLRQAPSTAETLRARAILRELGLARLAARPFLELSRGEQRRVLIARGVAFGARVLLLDEPASGLDRAARRDLDELLARVARRTQLVVTAHSAEGLPAPTTDVLELAAGRIVRRGAAPGGARLRGARLRSARLRSATPRGAVPGGGSSAEGRPAVAAARRLGNDDPGARRGSAAETFTSAVREPLAHAGRARVPLAEIERADVWLGGRRVLHALDWRLRDGEHWLVTGANGAGKSSFLRLLHGQLRPALGGRVRWPGLGEPRSVWRLRRLVAWFSPELQAGYRYRATVRECVASGFDSSLGLVRALTAAEHERVEALLGRFELTPLAERLTSQLSYGQFRRALLARALAPRPRVLLLDEPWEGLDEGASALLATRLDESRSDGVQLVCASHLETIGRGFTHELVLDRGRIREAGPLPPAPDGARRADAADRSPPPGQRDPASLS